MVPRQTLRIMRIILVSSLFFLVLSPGRVLCQQSLAAQGEAVQQAAPSGSSSPAVKTDTGDTAWLLASSALVLLMTPGLALFYGGMVRRKNVLGTMMQSFILVALVSVQWALFGYSLSFHEGSFWGGFGWSFLSGVGPSPDPYGYAGTVPQMAFMAFQLMFAIITPALIIGAVTGVVCFWSTSYVKNHFGYDDSLDAFGVHGVGGTVGAILTGVFATTVVNPQAANGLFHGNPRQLVNQSVAVLATWLFSAVMSLILIKIVDLIVGLRVDIADEIEGLDSSQHGESGYNLEA